MDLVLLGSNEGSLIDVGMYLDVRVVAELESVLWGLSVSWYLVAREVVLVRLGIPIYCNRQAW